MRTVALCFLLTAALPAWAATPINETRPLAADGQVSIENLKGRIVVRTWDRQEVRIGGRLGEGVEKLAVEGSDQNLSITVRYPRSGGSWFGNWGGSKTEPTDLEVTVPAAAALSIQSVSASVDVDGTRGHRLAIESVSGSVHVSGAKSEDVRIETVSGSQRLDLASQAVNASSVSGSIVLQGDIGGRVRVETVSGTAEVKTGVIERLDANTVSGSLELDTRLAANATVRAESVSGGIRLSVPKGTGAEVQIETFSGGIRSVVGEVITERYGPGKSLRARMGEGGGDIRLESFSGSVALDIH
ncbi:MAG TPA: DUF4097 family beta strand repeat-containing protein [Arenimonas sp.]|nr:DUF4097 family beta strand repeat-containing protein [Arenimonas sp.]